MASVADIVPDVQLSNTVPLGRPLLAVSSFTVTEGPVRPVEDSSGISIWLRVPLAEGMNELPMLCVLPMFHAPSPNV